MRWSSVEVVTPPTFEPVTLGEVKAHLRINHTEEDAKILGYLMAARAHVENFTGLRLATQTVLIRTDSLCRRRFTLPIAPVQSVALTYLDSDAAEQDVDEALYTFAAGSIAPTVTLAYDQSWPSGVWYEDAIGVTAIVGWPQGQLPDDIRHAILLMVGDWTRYSETVADGVVSTVPMRAVDSLLAPWRLLSV